jgi:hypothetical protein
VFSLVIGFSVGPIRFSLFFVLVVGFLPFPLVAFVGLFAFALVPIGSLLVSLRQLDVLSFGRLTANSPLVIHHPT